MANAVQFDWFFTDKTPVMRPVIRFFSPGGEGISHPATVHLILPPDTSVQAAWIGRSACLRFQSGAGVRYWHGRVSQLQRKKQHCCLVLCSPFWLLQKQERRRSFLDYSKPEVLEEILEALTACGVKLKSYWQHQHPRLPFLRQYDESDYDFFCRLILSTQSWFLCVNTALHSELWVGDDFSLPAWPAAVSLVYLAEAKRRTHAAGSYLEGYSHQPDLYPGAVIQLHAPEIFAGNYRILRVWHWGSQTSGWSGCAAPVYSVRVQLVSLDQPIPTPEFQRKRYHRIDRARIALQNGRGAPIDELGRYPIDLGEPTASKGVSRWPRCCLAQPALAKKGGAHWPLQGGTLVLVAYENGDPEKPRLLGPIVEDSHSSIVTNKNRYQHLWVTNGGQRLCLDDRPNQAGVVVQSAQQAQTLLLKKGIVIQVKKGGWQAKMQGPLHVLHDKDYRAIVKGNQSWISEKGIHWQSETGSLRWYSGQGFSVKAQQGIRLESRQGLVDMHAGRNSYYSAGSLKWWVRKGVLSVEARQGMIRLDAARHLSCQGSVVEIRCGKSGIMMDGAGGITVFGRQITLNHY